MAIVNLEFLTKVLPPRRREDVLRRQRLLDFLHEHVNLRVQTISAPAGYGKTTLLVDFASDVDIPVCWYSLDASDQDPMVFLDTLLTAIRYHFPNFGRRTEAMLRASADITKEVTSIVGILSGEMFSDVPELLILVLEDYHSIEADNTIKSFLNLLLERAPGNCHFIISSRTSVDLPIIAKLRVRRELALLGESELSFTTPEVRQLLADNYKIQLSEIEAQKLTTTSEGWIAGILLGVSTSFQNRLPDAKLQLSSQDVFNYLALEVYEKQPPEIKDFLLLSSTFREIEPQLCDRFFKLRNSEQLMKEIERRNLFISRLEGERNLYRYHNLFRGFLQEKLRREQPESYLLLHKDAGSIFEDDSQWNESVAHYLAARAYADAVKIIRNVGESFLRAGKWQTVFKWIQALPEKVCLNEPVLSLLEAESLIHLGQVDKAFQPLNRIMGEPKAAQDWLTLAKALCWRSAAFRLTGHFREATEDARRAIRLLKQYGGPTEALGDAYRRLGNIYFDQGKLTEAERSLKRAIKFFLSGFDIGQIAAAHNTLGVVYKRLGNLDNASAHYEQARQYWEKAKNFGALSLTLNHIAVLYRRRGQYQLALDTLNAGLEKARLSGYQRTEALILINLANIKRDLSLFAEALSNYSQALELGRQVMEPSAVAIATDGIGQIYRLLGHLDKAEVMVKEALAQASERGQSYDAGLFTLQLGIVQYQRGKLKEAEKLLLAVHDLMERLGDKDALADCSLHLAQVNYLSKRYSNCRKWLQKVYRLVGELGYEEFLVVEGAQMMELLQYAISRKIGGDLFEGLIKKIDERSNFAGIATTRPEQPTTKPKGSLEITAYSLGQSQVFCNSKLLADSQWRSAKAREMFFHFLCDNGPTTKEQIMADLWPDVSPAKGNSLFHSNLYRLRRALSDMVIISQNSSYAIHPETSLWFDARELESNLSQARKLSMASSSWVSYLEQAEALYKGPFLKEFYSDWVQIMRRRLEDSHIEVLSSLAFYNRRAGNHNRAIELLKKAIAVDPYQAEFYHELAKCHLAAGQRASALRVCREYYKMLGEEMDDEPGKRVEDLIQAIMKTS